MWKILSFITKNLVFFIPLSLFLGFLAGCFLNFQFLKSIILFFTFIMIYPMMVNLKFKKVLESGDFGLILVAQILNFFIIPFLAYGIGLFFFKENYYLTLGLLMAGLVPTSGMTISWTGFAKGNIEAAVKMTVIGLILGSIALPFYVQLLMSAHIQVDMWYIFKQIIFIIFLPMIAGYLTQQYLLRTFSPQKLQKEIAPKLSGISTLGVLGIVFIAMALKAKEFVSQLAQIFYIFLPLLVLYSLNFFLSTLVGKIIFKREDAIALVYGTVMRNLSICLAISMMTYGKTHPEVALVIALAFIIQVQSAAWYVRLSNNIFGSPTQQ
ncbi:MAG: arsenic resistance protein [Caldimicrobium sp.]